MDSAHPTGSKRQLTPTPQNGPHLWKSCVCISYYLALVPPCIYLKILIVKKCNIIFWKWGGSKAVSNFSENSSDLAQSFFPYQQRIKLDHIRTWLASACQYLSQIARSISKPTINMILLCVQPSVTAAIWWSSLWTQMFLFHEMFHLLKCTMQQIKSTFARRASLTISRYITLYLSNFKETTKLFLILQFHFVRAFLLKLVEPP